jgi:hypothetical protein
MPPQKMSLIKLTLGMNSNSLREYSANQGFTVPDRMSEFEGYNGCVSYGLYNQDQNYDRPYSYTDCDGIEVSSTLGPEQSITFCATAGTLYDGGSDVSYFGIC